MNKRTRLILSVIGVGAVVVPVILLLVLTGRGKQSQPVDESLRQIDTKNVKDAVRRQAALASPFASPSASPTPEGSASASPLASPESSD